MLLELKVDKEFTRMTNRIRKDLLPECPITDGVLPQVSSALSICFSLCLLGPFCPFSPFSCDAVVGFSVQTGTHPNEPGRVTAATELITASRIPLYPQIALSLCFP